MRKECKIIVSCAFILNTPPIQMSSSASISAAKKRRANQVQQLPLQQPQSQPMQRPISAPGPNPSLANLTPAQRQQFLMQQQQRMQQQQQQQPQPQQQQQQQQQHQQQQQMQQQQQQQQQQMQPKQMQQQPQPQTRNPQANQLAWPAPPIYLMKQMDTILFQQSQSIDEIKNRLNCIEGGSHGVGSHGVGVDTGITLDDIDNIKPALMNDSEFVNGIVDNIMTNSNLSEIIEQVDTVQAENRELRELLYAQQKTINEMNIMLLKLLSQTLPIQVLATATSVMIPGQTQFQVQDQVQVQVQDQAQDQVQYQAQDQDQDQIQDQDQAQVQDQVQSQNVELEIEDK